MVEAGRQAQRQQLVLDKLMALDDDEMHQMIEADGRIRTMKVPELEKVAKMGQARVAKTLRLCVESKFFGKKPSFFQQPFFRSALHAMLSGKIQIHMNDH